MTTTLVEVAIVVGLLALAIAMLRWQFLDLALWAKRSEKVARDYGIAVRPDIAEHVARHLRRQAVLSLVINLAVVVFVQRWFHHALDAPSSQQYGGGYRVTLVALPMLTIAYGLALAFPAWKQAQEDRRVTHLVRPTPRQTFTRHEWTVLRLGVLVNVVGGAFGLAHDASGEWWSVWLAALVLSAFVWWGAVKLILARPARASDDAELGWDDVLRHKQVREFTIVVAWIPALIVTLTDWTSDSSGNLLPFYVAAAVAFALSQAFKQGRHLWRQSWEEFGPT